MVSAKADDRQRARERDKRAVCKEVYKEPVRAHEGKVIEMTHVLAHPYSWTNEAPVSIYDMFNEFFNEPARQSQRVFKVDISEDDKGYTVEADLPGVSKDQIDIQLEDEKLTISVDYTSEKEDQDEEKNYIHRERKHVSMARGCYLKDADPEKISAKLEDGVLTIDVPKSVPESNVHKIDIA